MHGLKDGVNRVGCMARAKKDEDFFSDFCIFSVDELNEMDFLLSNMRFFEKGVLETNMNANSKAKFDPENCFFLIVPKSERTRDQISIRAA